MEENKKMAEDKRQTDLEAELREMISLGWKKQEAYDNKEAFIRRIGDVGNFFSVNFIFKVWESVWEQN